MQFLVFSFRAVEKEKWIDEKGKIVYYRNVERPVIVDLIRGDPEVLVEKSCHVISLLGRRGVVPPAQAKS
jgi:hypothetical protein